MGIIEDSAARRGSYGRVRAKTHTKRKVNGTFTGLE